MRKTITKSQKKDGRGRPETQKTEYMNLFLKHKDQIPKEWMGEVLKARPEWSDKTNRLYNVRYGRTCDLEMFREILKLIVK